SDLNQADALIHVVDISGSTDSTGKAVAPGSHDPLQDIAFLERELDYWYLDILKRGWGKFVTMAAQTKQEPHKAIAKQLSGLRVDEDLAKRSILDCGLEPKPLKEWSEDDLLGLATWLRKRTKPMLIAANKVDVPGAAANFERLRKAHPHLLVIPCSAEAELALREAERKKLISYLPGDADFQPTGALSDSQKKALDFIRANVLRAFCGSGIQAALNAAVFTLLRYKAIYPGGMSKLADSEGRVLPDCFLMPPEATALDFAFRLHTDFGKNFIKAMDVKRRMPVGKEHILKDGDVIEIMAGR
ncbi:MAG TPA: TGS domain-containing protein, partial [archaeon]|nr:TGS domain-containing protein [archaeon]